MSKSKGNAIKPQGMMDNYGADALRFWAAGSKLGDDLPFQEKDLVTGKKTVTKLWNSSKFALMHLEDYKKNKPKKLEIMDRWLLSKLNHLVKEASQSFEKYEYSKTKQGTENFFWQTFCDNYLEIAKDRLYNPDRRGEQERLSAQYTLYTSLLAILKLFAPIMPYITEEIFQLYFTGIENSVSIHNSSWPKADESLIDDDLENLGDRLVEIISEVRKAKSDNKMSLKEPVKCLTIDMKEEEAAPFLEDLKAITKAEKVKFDSEMKIEL